MPQTFKENRTNGLIVEYRNMPEAYKNSYGMVPGSSEMLDKPDPQRRKKPHDLFANSTGRTVIHEKRECITPYVTTTQIGEGTQLQYGYPYIDFLGPGLSPNYDPLMSSVLSKIKDQKVNIAVMIPELGKTTDLFWDLSRTVYEGYRRLRRGEFIRGAIWDRRRTSGKQSKWLAKRWLEFSYGIQPTMSDIWGLSQELQKKHTGNFKKVRSRQSQGATFRIPDQSSFRNITVSHEISVMMVARYRETATLHSLSSYGITNPLAVAWELIPYSFVLDWAIGVGDYLNNLDALVGIEECLVRSGSRQITTVSGSSVPWGFTGDNGSFGQSTSTRTVLTRNSVTAPYYPVPQIDMKLTKSRAANALALLRSLKL